MNHSTLRSRPILSTLLVALGSAALVALAAACGKETPPEPESKKPAAPPPPAASASGELSSSGSSNKDPLDGKWTLADATKNITGTGALIATIDTTEGSIKCKLYEDKAPITVANFVGLAEGTRTWKDPSGKWVNKPAYDGTTFHRVIKDFMIQGGDARGNGSGEPGYVIPDEIWPGSAHNRGGLLCMANRGPNTNGAQFFITEVSKPHLDGSYTIFGECSPLETVVKIASVKTKNDKPETPVTIRSVKIAREKAAKGEAKK